MSAAMERTFELDPWQSICPHCATVVAALDFHITASHPTTSHDVAPETEEADSDRSTHPA